MTSMFQPVIHPIDQSRVLVLHVRDPCQAVAQGRTFGIGRGLDDMQQSHVGDIIDVNFGLENDDQCLAVKFDGENRGREQKLADHGLSLAGIQH